MKKRLIFVPTNPFIKLFGHKEKFLRELIEFCEGHIPTLPKGNVRISQRSGYSRYYVRTITSDREGEYAGTKPTTLIKNIAQRQYEERILKVARKQLEALESFQQNFDDNAFIDEYEKLHPFRKVLVKPVALPFCDYAKKWEAERYEKCTMNLDDLRFKTERGDMVRSKSETTIANLLYKYGVPYKYDYALRLGQKTYYPDFVCLNKATRNIFFWEHFGRLSDQAYLKNTFEKIDAYHANNFFEGRNLIFTFESKEHPLTPQEVEKVIKEYLIV